MSNRLRKICTSCVSFFNRPVAWGAVILSYVGLFVGFGFSVAFWQDNTNDLALQNARQTQSISEQSRRADAALRHEANIRQRDLCHVIINSHNAAREDVHRLNRSIRVSRSYVRQSDADPALSRLIKQQLPRTIAARNTARSRARGLTPPGTCKPFDREK